MMDYYDENQYSVVASIIEFPCVCGGLATTSMYLLIF